MEIRQVMYLGISLLCVGIMCYQVIKWKLKGLTNLLFRLTGGVVGILCVNAVLGIFKLPAVGFNPFSLSVLGGLGMPGVVLLYILLNLQYM
ncbi:MAG: pro-sigmaK processing inhibitor BofA family protein [Lachnospiraceae bacterium]|nr:pro-sigmaK processing inhibitor BofA family protein [Lachnospiraceae bacterium]